jgi:hypothetical protein
MAIWTSWLNSKPLEWQLPAPATGVEPLRRQLLAVLDDCSGFESDRLRWRLHTAESGQDLWLLRDAVYQVIATQHCQSEAVDRINGLAPAFSRLFPQRTLSRV